MLAKEKQKKENAEDKKKPWNFLAHPKVITKALVSFVVKVEHLNVFVFICWCLFTFDTILKVKIHDINISLILSISLFMSQHLKQFRIIPF